MLGVFPGIVLNLLYASQVNPCSYFGTANQEKNPSNLSAISPLSVPNHVPYRKTVFHMDDLV